jgi:glutathione S-transferase
LAFEVRIPGTLKLFDEMLKNAGTTFVCGNEPSIADFLLFSEILNVFHCNLSFEGYPSVQQWHDACRQVPGLREVHEEFDKALPELNAQYGF